jgi:hypothetical protein
MNTRAMLLFSLLTAYGCGSSTSPTDSGVGADSASPQPDASAPDGSAIDDAMAATDVVSLPDAAPIADGSNPFADAGALGEPAWVPITVLTTGTCPAVAACGGDVVGTWDVSGACIEVPIESALAACPGAMVTRREGRARGRVVFGSAPMIARRVAQSEATVELFVPDICATPVGGCATLQALVQRGAPGATCTPTPTGACNCRATASYTIDDGDGYSIMGNEIVSATLNKRWEYCIAESTLRYRDTSTSGTREPGTISLRRR